MIVHTCFISSWEDDDTYASHDEKRFAELVELMNFPAPKLYAILRVQGSTV